MLQLSYAGPHSLNADLTTAKLSVVANNVVESGAALAHYSRHNDYEITAL